MKSAPALVLTIDSSRKTLNACASGAIAEPDVAVETAQLGRVEIEEDVSLVAVVIVSLVVVI
jgi:hypothetical protein